MRLSLLGTEAKILVQNQIIHHSMDALLRFITNFLIAQENCFQKLSSITEQQDSPSDEMTLSKSLMLTCSQDRGQTDSAAAQI